MWIDDYAEGLSDAASTEITVPDEDAVLDFTRRVAHGTERKNAPLATFLAGWYVGVQVAAGTDPGAAWEQAATLGDGLLEA